MSDELFNLYAKGIVADAVVDDIYLSVLNDFACFGLHSRLLQRCILLAVVAYGVADTLGEEHVHLIRQLYEEDNLRTLG